MSVSERVGSVQGLSAAEPEPGDPALDEPIVSRLANHARLARVVRTFGRTLPVKLAAMQAALDEGRLDDLADLAHWLKGAGGTVGFDVFFEPAREFERQARAGETAALARGLRQLFALADRLVIPEADVVTDPLPAVRAATLA